MNIGGHCLDRSLWLGGAPAATVRAVVLNRFESPVETDATVALRLTNGVDVSITVVSDAPRHIDEITVVCEGGIVIADPRTGTYMRKDGRTTLLHARSDQDIQTAFMLQLQDFVGVVAGAEPKVSIAHARHIVEVVLAAYDSAARGGDVAELATASTFAA